MACGGIQTTIPGEALQLPDQVDINIRANHLLERNTWKKLLSTSTWNVQWVQERRVKTATISRKLDAYEKDHCRQRGPDEMLCKQRAWRCHGCSPADRHGDRKKPKAVVSTEFAALENTERSYWVHAPSAQLPLVSYRDLTLSSPRGLNTKALRPKLQQRAHGSSSSPEWVTTVTTTQTSS